MSLMRRAVLPEELRQLNPFNTGGIGHGSLQSAVVAGTSIVHCSSVLHLSLVRTVVGATLSGLWQEDSSPSSILVSQNVFGNSKTLLGSWCFFCGTV